MVQRVVYTTVTSLLYNYIVPDPPEKINPFEGGIFAPIFKSRTARTLTDSHGQSSSPAKIRFFGLQLF
jgi:hypothetical protein